MPRKLHSVLHLANRPIMRKPFSLIASHRHSKRWSSLVADDTEHCLQTLNHHLQVPTSDCPKVPSRAVHASHTHCQLPSLVLWSWSSTSSGNCHLQASGLAVALKLRNSLPDPSLRLHSDTYTIRQPAKKLTCFVYKFTVHRVDRSHQC